MAAPHLEAGKEYAAVTAVANEITSSVHAYLLAASPRSSVGCPHPSTPAYTRAQATVLSPWHGCISHNLESSPLSFCATPPAAPSPEIAPCVSIPQHSPGRISRACQRSPTRNRFHSPTSLARADGCLASELQLAPALEDDSAKALFIAVHSTSSLGEEGRLTPEAEAAAQAHASQGATAALGPSRSLQGLLPYSSNRPPRPPRLSRKLSGKYDPLAGSWRGLGGTLTIRNRRSFDEAADNLTMGVLTCLLFVLFLVLIVYGGPAK